MDEQTQQKELTPEQLARIGEFRARWAAIGLNCDPAQRIEAEGYFRQAYDSIKQPHPRFIVWFDSPLAGAFACGLFAGEPRDRLPYLFNLEGVTAKIGSDIPLTEWTVVDDNGKLAGDAEITVYNIWKSLWLQLVIRAFAKRVAGADLATENKDLTYFVEIVVRENIVNTLEEAKKLGEIMFSEYFGKVADKLESSGRQKAWDACYGSHDASWLGFYEFFRDVVHYEKCNELNGLIGAAQTSGWFWPFESLCIATERHAEIHLDDRERLSHTRRPAVAYRDAFKVFAVNGVQVPSWLIEKPESLTVDHIFNERNAEIRRIMLQEAFMPRARFLKESNAQLVSEDEFGKLYRAQRGDLTVSGVMVEDGTVLPDGTRRQYYLGCLNTHMTAHEAVAWSMNMTTEEYKPTVRK